MKSDRTLHLLLKVVNGSKSYLLFLVSSPDVFGIFLDVALSCSYVILTVTDLAVGAVVHKRSVGFVLTCRRC